MFDCVFECEYICLMYEVCISVCVFVCVCTVSFCLLVFPHTKLIKADDEWTQTLMGTPVNHTNILAKSDLALFFFVGVSSKMLAMCTGLIVVGSSSLKLFFCG